MPKKRQSMESMTGWNHQHLLDLSTFSLEDYYSVLELSKRFNDLPLNGTRKLPALQGKLIATLFFEPSTRTRSSFELAAKRLSADVHNFNPSSSSLKKGETAIDTARTYIAMGADAIIVRHSSTSVPEQLVKFLEENNEKTIILNGGDGLHSHPSQGLLDLYTLAQFFNSVSPLPKAISGKKITIIGDILHSRVARSNLWALTACGADVILCGPRNLVPDSFKDFVNSPPPGQNNDPIAKRGKIKVTRSLKEAIQDTDAIITLRLQKERMSENLITSLDRYHIDYGINHQRLLLCKNKVPVLHPGPVNRGVEMSSALLDDKSICLIDKQVTNGIAVRMAILYLMLAKK